MFLKLKFLGFDNTLFRKKMFTYTVKVKDLKFVQNVCGVLSFENQSNHE